MWTGKPADPRLCVSFTSSRLKLPREETTVITMTERAAAGLEEMLSAHNAPSGQGVKLVP